MSNLDVAPTETTCTAGDPDAAVEILTPRSVPLGGPRAMRVRRTLPQRARSLVGGWCFVDHYGPDDVASSGGMAVPGHPHTGLQTVSWLFAGEVEHRDTTGAHAVVRPGEVNLMTAGAGIAHSEYSTPDTATLHGVQLWVALPDASRHVAPAFEHHVPEPVDVDGARVLVFVGSLAGSSSPVTTYSPLLGAEVTLPAGASVRLPTEPSFEYAVLVDSGAVEVDGVPAARDDLAYRGTGRDHLVLRDSGDGSRVVLLGGEPLGESIVMWWNFVGRSHDEVAAYRADWEAARAGTQQSRFAAFPAEWDGTLAAPALPNARLRPRS